MEEQIQEAVLTGSTNDLVLGILLELTIPATRDNRPLFPNLLDEPVLYRHFRGFVAASLEGLMKVENAFSSTYSPTGGAF